MRHKKRKCLGLTKHQQTRVSHVNLRNNGRKLLTTEPIIVGSVVAWEAPPGSQMGYAKGFGYFALR